MNHQQKPDGIEFLDARNKDDVEGVLALQFAFFPMPDDTGLRKDLLRHFFYSDLVKDGLVRCLFGRKDGKIVSYLVYTQFPNTYKKTGRRRHLLHIYWRVLFNLLFRPKRIQNFTGLFKRYRGDPQGRPMIYEPGQADILFLATVQPHGKWVPPGGSSRLTVRLFEEMVKDLANKNMTELFMTVRTSNSSSIRFCDACGCYKSEEVKMADGAMWKHYYYRIQSPKN